MTEPSLVAAINAAWRCRDDDAAIRRAAGAVEEAIDLLDRGEQRVASQVGDDWIVNEWLKKAVLLSFRLYPNTLMTDGLGSWYDRIPAKFAQWDERMFAESGIRAVPPCAVRRGAYVARSVVVMPSFINIGAYVGESSMIDTWASVGSCAQIGSDVHLSGGAGIGGVLEPMQARPTIIEDGCFIGARSEIAEGVIVRRGSVLAMGVFVSASTKIVHRETGAIVRGEIPPYSVVVPGSLPTSGEGPSLACAVIVKTVDGRTRAKTALNDLLRV